MVFLIFTIFRALCQERGFEPNIVLECDRHTTCYSMVLSNPDLIGSCFEFNEARIHSLGLKMLRLTDGEIPWSLYIISKKGKKLSPTSTELMDEIHQWFSSRDAFDQCAIHC